MKYLAVLAFAIVMSGCNPDAKVPVVNQPVALAPTPASTVEELPEIVDPSIPEPTSKPVFSDSIDDVTDKLGLERLRNRTLAANDIEVRIWYGFGKSALKGFILSRKADQWNAGQVGVDLSAKGYAHKAMPLSIPRSGWNDLWYALRKRNILTLPTADAIDCGGNSLDGFSFEVEIKKGNNYRTYMYDNPMYRKEPCTQAQDIMAIGKLIDDEFGTGIFTHQ